MIPRATMRLQLHKGFTFADAETQIPYLRRLGISHVYASPITTARAGSMHGYDAVDPTRVNPELGGEDALRRFVAALRESGLGLIIDIVPNHMAACSENAWWYDVLRHGRKSRYAPYFDIDWDAEDEALRGKVLLPFLGKPLREALEAGEITLSRDADGEFVRYYQQRYPVADAEDNARQDLHALLARQNYRLAWWRVANDEINWRRFFDINELVALRMEHPPAFADVHRLVFRLYAEGLIDGVRVDHVDGLSDPAGYSRTLRRRLDQLAHQRPASLSGERAYIVVEKILLRGEALPTDWGCDGTSGYDFMNDLSALQHDARGETPLNDLWQSVSGSGLNFAAAERAARREIIARSFSAQLEACASAFHALARAEGREMARTALRRSLIELLTHFPVYRTYATATERPERDKRFIAEAADAARPAALSIDRDVVDQIARWLGARIGDETIAAVQDRAVARFQQLSAPIAAKAVEDTVFYRYGRLISRNDVGFDVERFSSDAADFHARVRHRNLAFTHAMLASATHDHKRGEDVRARLAVLSEYASEWAEMLPEWIARCEPLRRDAAPHPCDIAILFQMIVGAWPPDLDPADSEGRTRFAGRLAQWQEKALREAKLHTDWALPNEAYETAARELLRSLIERDACPALLIDIAGFAARIAPAGALNGLAQTLLKLTAPGVPDIYQGTEFWDFSLVDPDNRRPVDFAARNAALDDSAPATRAAHWHDGRIKQALIARTLALRAARPKLFAQGSYQPLEVHGACADNIVAFARRHESDAMLVVVPRIASRLLRPGSVSFDPGAWKDTAISLPQQVDFANALSGEPASPEGSIARMSSLFARFPVVLLASSATR